MSDFLPKKSRRHYRTAAESAKLSATATDEASATYSLRVVDSSAGGLAFIVDEGPSRRFEEGQELDIRVASRKVFGTVAVKVRVIWVGDEEDDSPPHGCAFVEPEQFYATLRDDWWLHFNRRHALRVHFESQEPIPAAMMGGGVSVRSTLHDLSVLGISLYADEAAAALLESGLDARVSFHLFGDSEPVRFTGHVRHVTEAHDVHRIGIEFDPVRSPRFEDRTDDIVEYVRDRQPPSQDEED